MPRNGISPPPSLIEDADSYSWDSWFLSIYNRFGGNTGTFNIAGFPKNALPDATKSALLTTGNTFTSIIFVNNDVGGPTLAFSDGTNWRRVSDNNIIS